MDNFTHSNMKKFLSLSAIIFSALVLQACGAREEPFNGDPDGRGDSIEVIDLGGGIEPITAVNDSSKLITIRDSLEFASQWANYTTSQRDDSINFQTSQVILVDAGRLRACDSKSAVERVDAYESGDRIDFVIDYMQADGTASSSSRSSNSSNSSSSLSSSSVSSSSFSNSSNASSSCNNATLVHHYHFYYIKSRKPVFFEDVVN